MTKNIILLPWDAAPSVVPLPDDSFALVDATVRGVVDVMLLAAPDGGARAAMYYTRYPPPLYSGINLVATWLASRFGNLPAWRSVVGGAVVVGLPTALGKDDGVPAVWVDLLADSFPVAA